jgi:hypothetical protein
MDNTTYSFSSTTAWCTPQQPHKCLPAGSIQLTATNTCLRWTIQLTPSPVLQPDAHPNSLTIFCQLVPTLNWFHPAHRVPVFSTSVPAAVFAALYTNSQPGWPVYLSSNSSETCPACTALPAVSTVYSTGTKHSFKKAEVPIMGLLSEERRRRYQWWGYHPKKEGGDTIDGVIIQRSWRYHQRGYHPKKLEIPSMGLSSKEVGGTIDGVIIWWRWSTTDGVIIQRRWYHQWGYYPKKVEVPSRKLSPK